MLKATTWNQVETMLARQGIGILYKFRKGTNAVQGVSFSKDSVNFKGSAIDRSFSYSNIDKQLQINRQMKESERASNSELRLFADHIWDMHDSQNSNCNPMEHLGAALFDLLSQPLDIVPEPEALNEAERKRRKRKQYESKPKGIGR